MTPARGWTYKSIAMLCCKAVSMDGCVGNPAIGDGREFLDSRYAQRLVVWYRSA